MNYYKSANSAWLNNLQDVMNNGYTIAPRGIESREIIAHTCSFDMNFPICYHQLRRLSYKFMAAEAYWITSGSMFAEDIVPYNLHIAKFSDDNYIFNGNYGVPFRHQLQGLVNALTSDINTRQAVMTIWRPNPAQSKDYPCTISLMFNIRDGKLNTSVSMRSQDLWLGQPYDFFNFTIMSLSVLILYNNLNIKYAPIKLGTLYWSGFSTHIYEKDFDSVREVNRTLPNKNLPKVDTKCLTDWAYLAESLLHCRKNVIEGSCWNIRPTTNY